MTIVARNKIAVAKSAPIQVSERKAKIVCDLVRSSGKKKSLSARQAILQLKFSKRSFANDLCKVISAAMANAEHNLGMDIDSLIVSEICIQSAFKLKRQTIKGRGRSGGREKRFCRVLVSLIEQSYS